jgi:hypothetical protein
MNSTIIIINDLQKYFSLLNKIEDLEREYYEEGESPFPGNFSKSVSLRYNTITLQLNCKNEEEASYADYCIATFTVEGQNVSVADITCERIEREGSIRDQIQNSIPTTFPSTIGTDNLNNETKQYLNIADEIAKQAYLCSSGDDYYPGYFSAIVINDDGIILEQINHWNARSIDHKNNYYLRNLRFYIPNTTTETRLSYSEEKIGKLSIYFSDSSSTNNKKCGDKIFITIQEQKSLFENGQS